MHHKLYLDYSASTPVDSRVLEVMLPYFTDSYGNASSVHSFGAKAEDAVETSREMMAVILNCKPNEIVFTSGGSESDNLAIRGAAWASFKRSKGQHLITTPVEHSAVTHTVAQLVNVMGFEHTILPVDHYGLVDIEDFTNACSENTAVASVIYANNEIGTISPIAQLAQQAREQGVLLHTDAVQAAGQLPLDVHMLNVDMMSMSAHKFYGPKGVGALYIREGVHLESSQTGGSHEEGRRAGTLNTPGIVGMAKALQLAYEERDVRLKHYTGLRDLIIEQVLAKVTDSELTGHPKDRLPSHASFVFDDIDSSLLLMHLDMKGIAVSAGSACKTGNPEPSSVLLAMGYPAERAIGSLRLSVGQVTTEADVEFVVSTLTETVEKLRKLRREFLL